MRLIYSDHCDCGKVSSVHRSVADYPDVRDVINKFLRLYKLWSVVSRPEHADRHEERYASIHHRGRHVLGVTE